MDRYTPLRVAKPQEGTMSYREIKTFKISCDFCKWVHETTTDCLSEYLRSIGWQSIGCKDKCSRCIQLTDYACCRCNKTEKIDPSIGRPIGWSIRGYCRDCVELEDRGIKLDFVKKN